MHYTTTSPHSRTHTRLRRRKTLCALAQTVVFCIPARLAASWFAPGAERTLATAIAIGVNLLGIAAGFPLGGLFLGSDAAGSGSHMVGAGVAGGLRRLMLAEVGLALLGLVAVLAFVFDDPPTPPSATASAAKSPSLRDFAASVRGLFRSRDFVLLWLAFGINIGTYYALSTVVAQVMVSLTNTAGVGLFGAASVVAGGIGTVAVGWYIDKTFRYKSTAVIVYAASVGAMAGFAVVVGIGSTPAAFALGISFGALSGA